MKAYGDVQGLEFVPQRIKIALVPLPAIDGARVQEDTHEAEILHRPPGLGKRFHDVVGGDHGHASQSLWSVLTEVVEPVVVGSTNGRGERRVQTVETHDIEPDRWEQRRQIHPFTIHRGDLGDRIKTACGVGLEVRPHHAEHAIPALSRVGVHRG